MGTRFKKIGEVFFFLIAALPGLIFSYQTIQEPWTLFGLARLITSIQENHIATYVTSTAGYRVEHLGGEFIDTALLLASKLPAEWIGFLPLGSIFFVIIYYALAYKLSQSRWIAVLISVYVGWYYPRLVSQYSIQTYVWTNLLFIGFLIILMDWIKRRRVTHDLLIMILFVVTFLFYQTTPIWIIIALGVATFLIYLKRRKNSQGARVSWALPVFCIVIYLTFDTVFYNNFLERMTSEAMNQELQQSLASKILAPLFRQRPTVLNPYEMAPLSPKIATWSTLLSLVIMVVPIAYWCIVKVMDSIRHRDFSVLIRSDDDIFIWAVIAAALGHAIGYVAYGAVSIRVIPLAFPFLLPVIPRSLRLPSGNALSFASAILLAIISVVGFFDYLPVALSGAKPSDLGVSASLMYDRATLLADTGVFGSYQLSGATEGKIFELSWPDSAQYSRLVNPEYSNKLNVDFIVIDKYNKPIITTGWVYLEPWLKNIDKIDQNQTLNKIYVSNHIAIYQLKKNPLPYDQSYENNENLNPAFILEYMVGIVGAIIFVLILPGGVLLLVIKNRLPFDIGGPYIFSSLSLVTGISLVAIVGYLANFSPLGLDNMVWILIAFSIIAILFLIYRRKEVLPVLKLLIGEFLFVLILFVIWSVLMTAISYIRSAESRSYVEFFVTQDQEAGKLILNINNHFNDSEPFTMKYTIDGYESQTDPFVVMPDEDFRYVIDSPEQFLGKEMNFVLHSNNLNDDLTLHFILEH